MRPQRVGICHDLFPFLHAPILVDNLDMSPERFERRIVGMIAFCPRRILDRADFFPQFDSIIPPGPFRQV